MAQDILLHAYDPQWPALFEREKAALAAAAKGLFRQIYHIGSTAIPGMAAKPVIDILIVLNRHEDGFASAPAMEGLGYEYRGTSGAEGRHYFSNGAHASRSYAGARAPGNRQASEISGLSSQLPR
jgi:GrpB-like predicted nucleotidyltransferase (UPF0157 family)